LCQGLAVKDVLFLRSRVRHSRLTSVPFFSNPSSNTQMCSVSSRDGSRRLHVPTFPAIQKQTSKTYRVRSFLTELTGFRCTRGSSRRPGRCHARPSPAIQKKTSQDLQSSCLFNQTYRIQT
jgi:hypothetical protein